MSSHLDSFREAFDIGESTPWHWCECGREFGCEENQTYRRVTHWYRLIRFEGKEYVADCTCWHERAKKVCKSIDAYKKQIAKYLNLEKQRLTKLAEESPTVEV